MLQTRDVESENVHHKYERSITKARSVAIEFSISGIEVLELRTYFELGSLILIYIASKFC
jgi:hypothetical protein